VPDSHLGGGTVSKLKAIQGADIVLLTILRNAIAGREGIEVRYVRGEEDYR
jgi:hypothetical protein